MAETYTIERPLVFMRNKQSESSEYIPVININNPSELYIPDEDLSGSYVSLSVAQELQWGEEYYRELEHLSDAIIIALNLNGEHQNKASKQLVDDLVYERSLFLKKYQNKDEYIKAKRGNGE